MRTLAAPNIRLQNRHARQKKRIQNSNIVGKVIAAAATLCFATMAGAAVALVFPSWPIAVPILIGCGVAISDGTMYFNDIPKAFKVLFGVGLFKSIKQELIKEHLWAQPTFIHRYNQYFWGKLLHTLSLKLSSDMASELRAGIYHHIAKLARSNKTLMDDALQNHRKTLERLLSQAQIRIDLPKLYERNLTRFSDALLMQYRVGSVQDDRLRQLVLQADAATSKKNVIKNVKMIVSLAFVAVNGLFFAAMSFMSLGGALSALLAGTALLATTSLGIVIPVAIIALLGGFSFAMVQLHLLYKQIAKKGFQKMLKKLKTIVSEKFVDAFSKEADHTLGQRVRFFSAGIARVFLSIIVLSFAIIVNLATMAAFLETAMQTLLLVPQMITKAIQFTQKTIQTLHLACSVLAYGCFFLVGALFSIHHAVGSLYKVHLAAKDRVDYARALRLGKLDPNQAPPPMSLRAKLAYGCAVFITMVIMLIDLSGEIALAGRGAKNQDDFLNRILRQPPINMSTNTIVAVTMVATGESEFFDHIFYFKNPNNPITRTLRRFFNWLFGVTTDNMYKTPATSATKPQATAQAPSAKAVTPPKSKPAIDIKLGITDVENAPMFEKTLSLSTANPAQAGLFSASLSQASSTRAVAVDTDFPTIEPEQHLGANSDLSQEILLGAG